MGKDKGKDKLLWIDEELASLKDKGLFKTIRTIQSPIGPRIKIDGRVLINLCSNNYLGLASHPRLKKAAKAAIDKFGVGPAAVRTIAGTMSLHTLLEEKLAKFKKASAVISFQSGFVANLAVIPALVGEGDVIFSDELNHASIIDGCRLSKAQVVRYKHNDTRDLKEKITSSKGFNKKLIVTDGVFSMDGDIAPLAALVEVVEEEGCMIMVDDAHGEGVLGEKGRGIVDYYKLHGRVDVEVGTLSKAFGVVGGFVAGKEKTIELLRQKGRPFLFSSAMTVADVASCIEAVDILEGSGELVEKLWRNADYFKQKIKDLGFDMGKSQTPIIPVMLGDASLAVDFSKKLFEEGVFAVAIGYPTVALGKARIRVMSSASHTKEDLDLAAEAFEKVGKNLKVIPR